MGGLQCYAIKKRNRKRSINEFKKRGYERYLIYKQLRQDLNLCGDLFTRYSEKCFTQIYRALFGDAMLGPTNIGINMTAVK